MSNIDFANSLNRYSAFGPASLASGPFGRFIAFEPEKGAGSGGEGVEDSDAVVETTDTREESSEQKSEGGKEGSKLSDSEAALVKEVMQKKERLKATEDQLADAQRRLRDFDGIDPAEVRKLLQAQKDAERAAAEAKGDFERVKQMMIEEHKKETGALVERATSLEGELASARAVINDLTIGSAFNQSTFVSTDLVLTPAKARQVYGANFEIEDGNIVAYDKPKGEANRTKLVNSKGDALGFDEAIKKLVDLDPDRDRLLRSNVKAGAQSKTDDVKVKTKAPAVSGVARIRLSLDSKK